MTQLTFSKSDAAVQPSDGAQEERIKVIIADDEHEVHTVTRFVLRDYRYQGKKLQFLSAYSGEEAKQLLRDNPDASLILLDIVMERDDSGLAVSEFIRQDLENKLIRIILRTGQPGTAPEESVIVKYDVNDYKEKTELTDRKFRTAITLALRSYADIYAVDSFRALLEEEVQARTAELQEKNRELERMNKELELLATHDVLTGACNRLKFNRALEAEIVRCKRYDRSLSLVMVDVDHFKRVNDRFGHAAGDAVLCTIVALIARQIRASDVFARWGGEEFMIMLPETELEETRMAAEKLRDLIERHDFNDIGQMTCSFGVTRWVPDDCFSSICQRVDDALYAAKSAGRNKVVCR